MQVCLASLRHFFWLGAILGRFSINYFGGLGLRIRVRVRVWVRVWVRVGVRVWVRIED